MCIEKDVRATAYSLPPVRSASSPHHYHLLSQHYMGQNVEVEMMDGEVYQGRIYTYDHDHMDMLVQIKEVQNSDSRSIYPIYNSGVAPGFGMFRFTYAGIRRFRPYGW